MFHFAMDTCTSNKGNKKNHCCKIVKFVDNFILENYVALSESREYLHGTIFLHPPYTLDIYVGTGAVK